MAWAKWVRLDFASPKSMVVQGLKKSGFSRPLNPRPCLRFSTIALFARSTSKTGMHAIAVPAQWQGHSRRRRQPDVMLVTVRQPQAGNSLSVGAGGKLSASHGAAFNRTIASELIEPEIGRVLPGVACAAHKKRTR